MALFVAVTQIPGLVACPGRYRYILICDRVPLHPTLQSHPCQAAPTGNDWQFNAYRVQAHKIGSGVVVFSRNGHDFRLAEQRLSCEIAKDAYKPATILLPLLVPQFHSPKPLAKKQFAQHLAHPCLQLRIASLPVRGYRRSMSTHRAC